MDDFKKNMRASGLCPHCYKTLQETSGDKKWLVVKEMPDGSLYTYFLLKEIAPAMDDETYGTVTCPDDIPPDLESESFYWICSECFFILKEEIKRKNENPDQDEKWLNDLDGWR